MPRTQGDLRDGLAQQPFHLFDAQHIGKEETAGRPITLQAVVHLLLHRRVGKLRTEAQVCDPQEQVCILSAGRGRYRFCLSPTTRVASHTSPSSEWVFLWVDQLKQMVPSGRGRA